MQPRCPAGGHRRDCPRESISIRATMGCAPAVRSVGSHGHFPGRWGCAASSRRHHCTKLWPIAVPSSSCGGSEAPTSAAVTVSIPRARKMRATVLEAPPGSLVPTQVAKTQPALLLRWLQPLNPSASSQRSASSGRFAPPPSMPKVSPSAQAISRQPVALRGCGYGRCDVRHPAGLAVLENHQDSAHDAMAPAAGRTVAAFVLCPLRRGVMAHRDEPLC